MSAPALGLPDLEKPFTLYIGEREGVAVGVLTQIVGSWPRPVAYLSKQLDPVARGWPPCLRAVAAAAEVLHEATKLTLGQPVLLRCSHALITLLEHKGHHWLSNPRMLKYESMLIDNPLVSFKTCSTLNPATLLPISPESQIAHDCLEILDEIYSSRPDLKDTPLPNPDWVLFTDGSSFVIHAIRRAGYAVVDSLLQVIEASPLPPGTSAQRAELIALTRALRLSRGKCVNIYTDSKYAFTTLHAHGALYKERGLLTSTGQQIKNTNEILELLDAVWDPKSVAVMHCKGHQYGEDQVARGNRCADLHARQAAEREEESENIMATLRVGPLEVATLEYTQEEIKNIQNQGGAYKDGRLTLPDQRLVVPHNYSYDLVWHMHELTHLGSIALAKLLERQLFVPQLYAHTRLVSQRCQVCARNNPRAGPLLPPGTQHEGHSPFEVLVTDFTEMPRSGRYRYLLLFVCSHTGWVEAIPTCTEKACEVARALMRDIVPRYGIPLFIGSDNGAAFVQKVIQSLAKLIGVTWKLHCAYRPQSSGKVERMNRTLKNHLAKICQETGLNWMQALPLALLRIRCAPRGKMGLSPYELLYGRPPLQLRPIEGDPSQIPHDALRKQTIGLGKILQELHRYSAAVTYPFPYDCMHLFQPGDWVWLKDWRVNPLQPRWKGPLQVLLTTPTAVKLDTVKPWVHYTRIKAACPPTEWEVTPQPDSLKLTFRRKGQAT